MISDPYFIHRHDVHAETCPKLFLLNTSLGLMRRWLLCDRDQSVPETARKLLNHLPAYHLSPSIQKVTIWRSLIRAPESAYLSQVVLEHQIFTLGSDQNWRRIAVFNVHNRFQYRREVCINGVIYCLARGRGTDPQWLYPGPCLVAFDLVSEIFQIDSSLLWGLGMRTSSAMTASS
ncbi:hypothetical protein CRG98_007823 [Punica granatum]|uniref:F-box associated beta-propeller type 3 domain-containing protein n=1 Tax=Punica granatum TaxID=22663 RepID=A0A2I0KTJ2_PUNGR|nr:hypothetical protein CRG98_007823 [Punica granatum]